MRTFLLTATMLVLGLEVFAQYPPRRDDHFWKRKVVNRLDLTEKINDPLIKRESSYYTDNSQYTEKEGIIMALFNGLKQGKFLAYHPDSLNRPLSYDEVKARALQFSGETASSSSNESFDDAGGEAGFDEFDGGGGDDMGGEDAGGDESFTDGDDLKGKTKAKSSSADFDTAPFESVLQFVEDRIFDKTRSDMVYDIHYIEIIWVDPGETLPEKRLCTFQYKDVMETLGNSQWKNRFNDAEYRTFKEVFELRMFNSYVIDVSGQGVDTLEEADYRRKQLVEFEHNLWSY